MRIETATPTCAAGLALRAAGMARRKIERASELIRLVVCISTHLSGVGWVCGLACDLSPFMCALIKTRQHEFVVLNLRT